jgi:hypothetical protein
MFYKLRTESVFYKSRTESAFSGSMQASRNLVPRACDPREGTRGSGIIHFREESDWPLKWNA